MLMQPVRPAGRWLREALGMSAASLLAIVASIAMVSGSTWSFARSTVPIGEEAAGYEGALVWEQMILYFATVALFASFFPDVGDEDLAHAQTSLPRDAKPAARARNRAIFLHVSRLNAVGYILLHWAMYQYCRLLPLQDFDALAALLTGRTTLSVSTWIQCCASLHLSLWMVLPWPFVIGGLQLTQRLRSRYPPWKALRCATGMIGLNDLLLWVCITAYLDVTAAGGHNPLPADIAQQLYLLHARTCAHAITQTACAFVLTPANRLRLAWWREALTSMSHSAVVRPASHVLKAVASTGKPPPDTEPIHRDEPTAECVICMDGAASSILAPCGHMCVCSSCGDDLAHTKALCPLCRQPVQSTVNSVFCM